MFNLFLIKTTAGCNWPGHPGRYAPRFDFQNTFKPDYFVARDKFSHRLITSTSALAKHGVESARRLTIKKLPPKTSLLKLRDLR